MGRHNTTLTKISLTSGCLTPLLPRTSTSLLPSTYISPPLRVATKCSSETNTACEQSIVMHNAVCLPADKRAALIKVNATTHAKNLTKWEV